MDKVIKLTQKAFDETLQTAEQKAVAGYKDELKEKGFDPDNVDEILKKAQSAGQTQTQTQIGAVKEAKHFPIGYMIYATAIAKNQKNVSVLDVIKKDIDLKGNYDDARIAIQTMHKAYDSNGHGERLREFEAELKTIGMSPLLDGIGSDGGFDMDIAELLRPNSVVFNLQGVKQRTLINGSYTKRIMTSGTDGAWLGETEQPDDEKSEYKEITLRAKRGAVLTTISKASLTLSNKDLQREAEEELLEGLGELVDTAFFTGTGTNHTPIGLDNRTGFKTIEATMSADATEVGVDLDKLHAEMVMANIKMRSPYWLGTQSQKIYYGSKYTSNGQIMNYAQDLKSKGILNGFPMLASNYVSTDNETLWLIDASEFILANGYGMMIDIDDNYDFAGGKIGIKSEISLDWNFQKNAAVGKLTLATRHIS